MESIVQFETIEAFAKKLNMSALYKSPEFLVVDYSDISHDAFKVLNAYKQEYFEVTLDVTLGCNILVDKFELLPTENRLTLVSPYRLQKILEHDNPVPTGGIKGFSLYFKPEFLDISMGNKGWIRDFPFFDHLQEPSIKLSGVEAQVFYDLASKIAYEYRQTDESSDQIIKNYLHILLLKARQKYAATLPFVPVSREQEIYQRFVSLVEKYAEEFYTVGAYADLIHVSPKHLSETIKKITGKSALHFIHENRMGRAKSLLKQTHLPVTDIAYRLNFESPDYFSSFFKRLTGKTPLQFRMVTNSNLLQKA